MATTRPARSIGTQRPDLHPSLIRFVDTALAYDKAARFADAASMQHALRVTFAEINGHAASDAMQLELPDLQSMPGARAITIRNLKAPDFRAMSGQPTVAPKPASAAALTSKARSLPLAPKLWLALALAAAFLLIGGAWLRSRAVATIPLSDPGSPSAHGLPLKVAAPPQPSALPEPKPVRLDDLPQELPPALGSSKKALPRR